MFAQDIPHELQELTENWPSESSIFFQGDARLDEEITLQNEPPTEPASIEHESDEDLNSIKLYLQEIQRYPLLLPKEESALGQQITEAAAERRKPEHIQRHQVIMQGEEAARRLTNANLRLVVSVAKSYKPKTLSMLDLIQEGNVGLMRAVQKFDYRRGYRFSTYATWWIRQAILRAIAEKDRTIRLPVHSVDTLHRVRLMSQRLVQDLGREPTVDEIASTMGLPVGKIRLLLKAADLPISLNILINDEYDEVELSDFIPAVQSNTAEEATHHILSEQIREVLAILPEREREVLELRFGLKDGISRTLEEVGLLFHVSRERIRQIEQQAINRLRHSTDVQLLKDIFH